MRQPAAWPAHPAPAAGAVALRKQCSSGVAPVVATDDRGFGMVFVLMGDVQNYGTCELRRAGDSYVLLSGGAAHSDDPVPDDAFRVVEDGIGPPWTPERAASASPLFEWRVLNGIAPKETASVRVVVGNQAVEATLAGRLFVVAWPVDTKASLLVALDADGAEIARLTSADIHSLDDDGVPGD